MRASRKNGGLLPPAAITDLENDEDQMWEGLAPDGGVSASSPVADTPPSGASPLPHF
ncbi:hypothetical protein C4K02_4115 [Pseudomonas synxantha]|nr:hypothetical protein C4K02_4115 [Pseudomonas synxantha]